MTEPVARRGWNSTFRAFEAEESSRILKSLRTAYSDSSESEIQSWRQSVPMLQREVGELIRVDTGAGECTAVLEYELPMESRRTDAMLLMQDVIVIELKGKTAPTDADIDQAHAYARDLRCYHRDCHEREVHPVLVPTRLENAPASCTERNVWVCPPAALDSLVAELSARSDSEPLDPARFLSADAYKPLPTLIAAARDLLLHHKPPQLWHSAADTDAAVSAIHRIIRDSHDTGRRSLILLTGVPGSGKTLVGLRAVHAPELDDLRSDDDQIPAVFLSGNGPLVEVLQHVLRAAGGGGSTFVRPIREYVRRYGNKPQLLPPEHVVVFDEAQRAFDRNKIADTHRILPAQAHSEPEYFVGFAQRKPDWAVIVGLVGDGQEIHIGEEGGIGLWATAIQEGGAPGDWTIHGPPTVEKFFPNMAFHADRDLGLDATLRSHRASMLHDFVGQLLRPQSAGAAVLRRMADKLRDDGHDFRITRNLARAKNYLRERYRKHPDARFGMVASSKDKDLESCGVPNGYMETKQIKHGHWYADGDDNEHSCRHLRQCVTEFGAQGLELDAVLLAWGTDFVRVGGRWSNAKARRYRKSQHASVKDPWQLRANAYRVLLTRGRDAHVVFVPALAVLDETWEYLVACGFRELADTPVEPAPDE